MVADGKISYVLADNTAAALLGEIAAIAIGKM
jgi:hypothetical protein